jgi:hypothetical protein
VVVVQSSFLPKGLELDPWSTLLLEVFLVSHPQLKDTLQPSEFNRLSRTYGDVAVRNGKVAAEYE